MTDVRLLEQYEDDKRLLVRKFCHKHYSISDVDTQYEVIRRIGNASSVLDIGCGSGDLLVKLRTIGYKGKLKGIDKYNIVNVGARNIQELGMDIEMEQMDVENQTETNKWDVGTMVSILCLTPKFLDIIKRYSQICSRLIIVDVASGGFPRLNRLIPDKIEQKFKTKMTTREIGFNMQDTLTEMTKYYETIHFQRLDDAFKFKTADELVQYFETNDKGGWHPEPSQDIWNDILTYVKSIAQEEIDEKGFWLEPKPYFVITAENPIENVIPYTSYVHRCDGIKV
ncbi:MAG: class I SAM-dependent methyltransferase [Thermoplasmata archaeon]|nr:MAG: class I SAM-dependent methyltransferase [Thermoplasmata archaeon]